MTRTRLLLPALLSLVAGLVGCGKVTVDSSAGGGGSQTSTGGTGGQTSTAGGGSTGSGGAECVPSDDGNPCTEDTCVDGSPAHLPLPDGATCDAGDPCTPQDTCQSGACVPGAPLVCGPGTSCVGGACLAPVCTGAIGLPALPQVVLDHSQHAIETADFDGDGRADIAVGGLGVAVALNEGHGTFTRPVTVSGESYGAIDTADLNGDGAPDLVGSSFNGMQAEVMWNQGGGSFSDPVALFPMSNTAKLWLADLDGDASVDIVVRGAAGAQLYFNQGDGTFGAPITEAAIPGSGYLAMADFDGDGLLDIAANRIGFVDILLQQGGGAFAAPVSYLLAPSTYQLTTGDFDGDGAPDLAALFFSDGSDSLGASVLLNQGGGVFAAPVLVGMTCGFSAFRAADVDGDGKADLVCGSHGGATVVKSLGGGAFSGQMFYSTSSYTSVAVVDVTGDGEVDLLVNNVEGEDVSVLHNRGDGTFGAESAKYNVDVAMARVAVADLDGDGVPDVVTSNVDGSLSWFRNQGDGTLSTPVDHAVTPEASALVTGDFNGDGTVDVLMGPMTAEVEVRALWNQGNGALSDPASVLALSSPVKVGTQSMAARDLDADGDLDLALIEDFGVLEVALNDGAGSFAAPIAPPTSGELDALAIGDLDGDGDADLAVTTADAGDVLVLWNDGAGNFSAPESYAVYDAPYLGRMRVVAADLNGDGAVDLAFSTYEVPEVRVLSNQGGGTFGAPQIYEGMKGSLALIVADVNSDGFADLVAGSVHQGDSVAVLVNHGDGTFASPQFYTQRHPYSGKGWYVSALAAADLNGDGRTDLASLSYGLQVLLNACLP